MKNTNLIVIMLVFLLTTHYIKLINEDYKETIDIGFWIMYATYFIVKELEKLNEKK